MRKIIRKPPSALRLQMGLGLLSLALFTGHALAKSSLVDLNRSFQTRIFERELTGDREIGGIITFYPGAVDAFINDSEGAMATFRWHFLERKDSVEIGISADAGLLEDWQGESRNGVVIIRDFGECQSSGANKGDFAANLRGDCSLHLGLPHGSIPPARPWDKRFVRLVTSEGNFRFIRRSIVHTVANVPDGMVFVDSAHWPEALYPKDSVPSCLDAKDQHCRFDFAIDKFETSLADVGDPRIDAKDLSRQDSCSSYPCSFGQVLQSQRGREAAHAQGNSWLQFKQMCLNRSYAFDLSSWVNRDDLKAEDRFQIRTLDYRRKIHVLRDIEFTVAAWGTSDETFDLCQTQGGRHASGDALWQDCLSQFGAHDLIGNHKEATDSIVDSSLHRIEASGTTEESTMTEILPGPENQFLFVQTVDPWTSLPTAFTSNFDESFSKDIYDWKRPDSAANFFTRGGGEANVYNNIRGIDSFKLAGIQALEIQFPIDKVSRAGPLGDIATRCALSRDFKTSEPAHLAFVPSQSQSDCTTLASAAGFAGKWLSRSLGDFSGFDGIVRSLRGYRLDSQTGDNQFWYRNLLEDERGHPMNGESLCISEALL